MNIKECDTGNENVSRQRDSSSVLNSTEHREQAEKRQTSFRFNITEVNCDLDWSHFSDVWGQKNAVEDRKDTEEVKTVPKAKFEV